MKALRWIFLTASLGTLACGGPKGYVIRGEVTGFPDSTMFYLRNMNAQMVIDSAPVVGGRFQMQGILSAEPEQMFLYTSSKEQPAYASVLMGNETVDVRGDVSDFPFRVVVSGSKYQDQQKVFNDLTREYDIRRDSLVALFLKLPMEQWDGEPCKQLGAQMRRIDRITDSLQKDYIFSHPDTYPSLITLGYKMYDFPKDTVQMLFEKMSPELQSSQYGKPIQIFLSSGVVSVGDPFHDFEAEDQNGKKLRLSDLVGQDGKYTLLEFTDAGCGACILAAKQMRQMVDTYSDSLRILSFSMDKNREDWQQSLVRDSVCWTSLWSEKGGMKDEICVPYRVRSRPVFFLIDPQGKIVQKWNGYNTEGFDEEIGRLKNK